MPMTPKSYIRKILSLLAKEEALLSQKRTYGLQKSQDIKSGFIKHKSGLYLPLKAVEPRILFESYENLVVKTFRGLLQTCIKNANSPLLSFTFRTIMELGFNRGNAFFASAINSDEKRKIKLLSILSDYVYINSNWSRDWFRRLYDAEKTIFTAKERTRIENIVGYPNITQDGIFELRRYCAAKISSANDLVLKATPGANQDKLKSIYGSYSHMIHGNVFQIETALNQKNKPRAKVHLQLFIASAGFNFAKRVAEDLSDKTISKAVSMLEQNLIGVWNLLGKDLLAARVTKKQNTQQATPKIRIFLPYGKPK